MSRKAPTPASPGARKPMPPPPPPRTNAETLRGVLFLLEHPRLCQSQHNGARRDVLYGIFLTHLELTVLHELLTPGPCTWTHDEWDDTYQTSCGQAFIMTAGTLAENGMGFCCYCGKPLLAKETPDDEAHTDQAPAPDH